MQCSWQCAALWASRREQLCHLDFSDGACVYAGVVLCNNPTHTLLLV